MHVFSEVISAEIQSLIILVVSADLPSFLDSFIMSRGEKLKGLK